MLDKIAIVSKKAKKYVLKVTLFWLFSQPAPKNPTFDAFRQNSTYFATQLRPFIGFFSQMLKKVQLSTKFDTLQAAQKPRHTLQAAQKPRHAASRSTNLNNMS